MVIIYVGVAGDRLDQVRRYAEVQEQRHHRVSEIV